MKQLLLCLLLSDPSFSNIGNISPDSGIAISHCHPGHFVSIHVYGQTEGWFKTTNDFLTLKDLSMIPDGTNLFEIRSICRGMTSEVSVVQFNLQRPPPKPRIEKRRVRPYRIPAPPIPSQLVMALPGGTNDTYADYRRRMREGKRRNQ